MKKPKLSSFLALVPQSKARKPMNKLQAHANRLTHSAYDDHEEPTTKLSTAFVVVLALHVVAVAGIYAFHSIKAKRREADGTAVAAKVLTPAPAAAPAPAVAAAPPKPITTPLPAAPAAKSAAAPGAAPAASVAPKTSGVGATAKTENAAPHLAAPSGPSAVIPAQKATPAQNGQASSPSAAGAGAGASVAAKAQPPSVMPIKAVAVVPAVQAVQAGTPQAADSAHKTYTVVKGDNPVAIAKRLHVNYEEMLKLNNIEDPKKLQIGQTIKLPASKQNN